MSDETQRRIGKIEGHIDGIKDSVREIKDTQKHTYTKLDTMKADLMGAIANRACPEAPNVRSIEERVDDIEGDAADIAALEQDKARDWRRLLFQVLAGAGVIAVVAVGTLLIRKALNGLIVGP